jgi:hypothetical protein
MLEQALPADLSGMKLRFDCSELRSASPSSLDELVRILFLERGALQAHFSAAQARINELLLKTTADHGFRDRVTVEAAGRTIS